MRVGFVSIAVALGLVIVPLVFAIADDRNPHSSSSAPSAFDSMQKTVDEVVKVVESLPGEDRLTERRAKLREVINPRFDFEEMSKRSLGSFWKEITDEQQREFVRIFSDLLARTYLAKVERVRTGMVVFDSEKVEHPRAVVKSTVLDKGDRFPLDYKMSFQDGQWRVYDVVIENIGLVANYRNEFAGIIRRESFDGLLARLREKTK